MCIFTNIYVCVCSLKDKLWQMMTLYFECSFYIRKDLISINLHKAKSILVIQSISAIQVSQERWSPSCPTTWAPSFISTYCKERTDSSKLSKNLQAWAAACSPHRFYKCVHVYIIIIQKYIQYCTSHTYTWCYMYNIWNKSLLEGLYQVPEISFL